MYGLVVPQHNALVAQLTRARLASPALLQKKKEERLRRFVLFPVTAAVTTAMKVVSAVPALGDYLERLTDTEQTHF
jgi:hypothetical protein